MQAPRFAIPELLMPAGGEWAFAMGGMIQEIFPLKEKLKPQALPSGQGWWVRGEQAPGATHQQHNWGKSPGTPGGASVSSSGK